MSIFNRVTFVKIDIGIMVMPTQNVQIWCSCQNLNLDVANEMKLYSFSSHITNVT